MTENNKHNPINDHIMKDYLYKVAKIKENTILCTIIDYVGQKKNNNQLRELTNQPDINTIQKQQQEEEEFDYDVNFPIFCQQNDLKSSTSSNLKKPCKGLLNIGQKNNDNLENIPNNSNTINNHLITNQNKKTKTSKNNHQQIPNHPPQIIPPTDQLAYFNKPFIFDQLQDEQQTPHHPSQHQNTLTQQNKINTNYFTFSQDQSPTQSTISQQQIKGMTITSNSLDGNVMIKITNKTQLVLSKLPPGIILKCIIRRSSIIFNPQFDFYINNGMKHILSARKTLLNQRDIYQLSLELGKYQERDIIGSIITNTIHNIYWLYRLDHTHTNTTYELKTIVKYSRITTLNSRKMNVHLFTNSDSNLKTDSINLGHDCSKKADLVLQNQSLHLKQNSSKNYNLIDTQDQQYHYLKMNKVASNMFQIEIQHPLSPIQAFAISLTRFDAQLK